MSFVDSLKSKVSLPEGKDKTLYVILAIFLGSFGIHNFWAGNDEKAKSQLILGILSFFTCGIAGLVSWVTAILDVVNLDK